MSITLNEEQRAAVEAPVDRPVKVSAGAGTGKTMALTARYMELLRRGYSVDNILALTFTRKAAAEMRVRIFSSLANPRDIIRAHIYNFDAFFLYILTSHALQSGIDGSRRIISGTQRNRFIREVSQKAALGYGFPPISLQRIDRYMAMAFSAVEEARMKLITPEEFERCLVEASIPREFGELALNLYRRYEISLEEEGALDFNDISLRCHALLVKDHRLRLELRNKHRYILLDEVQDTNLSQYKLLSLIAEEGMSNVTAVGDDKQSIYGFRGAEIGNLRDFKGEDRPLFRNYRSTEAILSLAHQIICQDEYFRAQGETIRLHPAKQSAGVSVYFVNSSSAEIEAEWTADRIVSLMKGGIEAGNIAVICRRKAPLRAFEQAFRRGGIPYRTIGGGYYDREEIKDILSLLKFICDSDDKGAETRLTLRNFSRNLWELNNNPGFRAKLESLSLSEGLMEILQASGYMKFAGSLDSPEQSAANINKLVEMAADLAGEEPSYGLIDFIGNLETGIVEDTEEKEAEVSGGEAVSLLTIHQSKGLEWDVVFAVDFREKRLIQNPDFIFNKEDFSLVLRKNPFTEAEYPEYKTALTQSRQKEREREEEIRLQYVAVTRARNSLYVSYSGKAVLPPALENQESYLQEGTYEEIRVEEGFETAAISSDAETDRIIALEAVVEGLRGMPSASGGACVELNFTALRDFLLCPKYYWLKHRLNLPEVVEVQDRGETEDYGGAVLGSVFHRMVFLDPHLRRDWREVMAEAGGEGASPEFVRKIEGLIRSYSQLGLDKNEIIVLERGFRLLFTEGGIEIRFSGVIDRLDMVKGEIRILDYKTGVVDATRLEEYRLQLSCYGLAGLRGALGEEFSPKLAAAALGRGEIIDVDFQPDAEETIKRAAREIAGGEFPPRESEHCGRCPYRGLCGA